MDIAINYWAVLVCAIVSMVTGAIWYGPIFGKKWIEIIEATDQDLQKREEMQKNARPLYAVTFILTLFQAYVLAHFINGWQDAHGVVTALWIWAAFLIPTIAGSSMWTIQPSRIKWAQFLIQGGYQLLNFIIFGLILHYWK